MVVDNVDYVHDVAYDHSGRRVATCSSDNTIKVFDEAGHKVAEWKAHTGSIWRLSWAHPEFGVALASCSFDRKVCIWEDTAEESPVDGTVARIASWPRAAELADARDSVVDLQFAPHHMGVRLASCSADGFVRVHEAPDVLDLASWEKHSEFDAAEGLDASSVGSSVHGGSTLALGAGGGGSGGGLGGSGAGLDGGGDTRRPEPLCLAWCPSVVEGSMLLVGMTDGRAVLWGCAESGWSRLLALGVGGGRGHSDCVRSVSWAADVGRSYHLLATGSRDKLVRLWNVQRTVPVDDEDAAWAAAAEEEGGSGGGGFDVVGDGWKVRCCAELPHRSQVWRVSWNASGSMLATSEDDGSVSVFKMDAHGGWRQAKPIDVE